MDFRLYSSVLWRFRVLVAAGFLVALVVSALAIVTVGRDGIAYRESQLWSSTSRLLVTQKGFPWGRLYSQEGDPANQAERLGIPLVDPNRLNSLAILYAEMATSDPILADMRRESPIDGQIVATPVVVQDGRVNLPLIDVTGIASTPRGAIDLARRASTAFQTYLREQQRANDVPAADRVVVQELVQPRRAVIFQGRSKTLAAVVFLVVMFAVVGLAFLLENMRPRARPPAEVREHEFHQSAVRRAAK